MYPIKHFFLFSFFSFLFLSQNLRISKKEFFLRSTGFLVNVILKQCLFEKFEKQIKNFMFKKFCFCFAKFYFFCFLTNIHFSKFGQIQKKIFFEIFIFLCEIFIFFHFFCEIFIFVFIFLFVFFYEILYFVLFCELFIFGRFLRIF